ncbi:MAG: hypothetical protein ACRDNS_32045, partial [Trebonia sp.]
NTLGLGATTGSPSMRLRLFERLARLVGWRFGAQGEPDGRSRNSRTAGAEASGRHRRNLGGRRGGDHDLAGVAATPTTVARTTMPRTTLPPTALPPTAMPPSPRSYTPGHGGGMGRARIREAPFGAAPLDAVAPTQPGADRAAGAAAPGRAAATPRRPWYQVVGDPPAAKRTAGQGQQGRAKVAAAPNGAATGRAQAKAVKTEAKATRAPLPFARPHPREFPVTADGRRSCGPLESILWRQWDVATTAPPPEVAAAIDRLAEFPRALQEKLAAGLDGIYVGVGGVPDLDHMAALHGVPLPSGKATWDACAGAYGDRKIVVGTRPSPTPDVICHEVGHALDDLDSPPGKWQSDSAEFRLVYEQCQPFLAADFHRQRGGLGRKEFFADSFAAIASAQRPALVDMLSGNTRVALRVMLYFNRRYGI